VTATADIVDEHGERAAVCGLDLRQFGGVRAFSGSIATIRCYEDNVLVRERAAEQGEGRVLVVDAGGSLRVALVGDQIAALAHANGWAGIVLNGCVRDAATLAGIPLGLKALATTPRRSAKNGGGDIDIAVFFGGIELAPGAMLYADDDGVVVVPGVAV
jgi:regulator of ribonuclease activity A